MAQPRCEKICGTCEYNMFKDDNKSPNELECMLDNDVNSPEWCSDYSKVDDDGE